MLCMFSLGCFQIYRNKSAKNIAVHFIRTIVLIKCMPKISAVGLFCLDKFENNQTRTCTTFFRTSKLTEVYFKSSYTAFKKPVCWRITCCLEGAGLGQPTFKKGSFLFPLALIEAIFYNIQENGASGKLSNLTSCFMLSIVFRYSCSCPSKRHPERNLICMRNMHCIRSF